MIGSPHKLLAKAVLRGWPRVSAEISDRLTVLVRLLDDEESQRLRGYYQSYLPSRHPAAIPVTPAVTLDDAPPFVQTMAAIEGKVRVELSEQGCRCKPELRITSMQPYPGGSMLAFGTFHDPWCPWLQLMNEYGEAS